MVAVVRKASAERRVEIARAVLRIIGEQGITSFTTTALAKEIGVTSGALFRHFASRDEILQETVRYAVVKIEETFPDRSLPATERLLQLARNRVRLLGSEPGIVWLLRSEQAHLTLPKSAVKLLDSLIKRSRQFLLDAIREGARQGTIRDDIKPDILLVLVMGTIHALLGMPGIRRPSKRKLSPDPELILSALMRMIAPGPTTQKEIQTPERSK
jgi:AcrR family transcriptional regulator